MQQEGISVEDQRPNSPNEQGLNKSEGVSQVNKFEPCQKGPKVKTFEQVYSSHIETPPLMHRQTDTTENITPLAGSN